MIVKFDFGNDMIQYISCSAKVGRKINKVAGEMINWFHDESKNKKYWIENEDVGESIPNFAAPEIVEWLNNVKFKKGRAKAKVIKSPYKEVEKTVYL